MGKKFEDDEDTAISSDMELQLEQARWKRGERLSILTRWVVLALLAINAHITAGVLHSGSLGLDATIGGWAVITGIWSEINRRWQNQSIFISVALLLIDIMAAAVIVALSGSYLSPLDFAFVVPVAVAGIRFGVQGGLLIAVISGVINFSGALWLAAGPPTHAMIAACLQTGLLLFVGGGLAGMLADEDMSSREEPLRRAYELENQTAAELGEVDRVKTQFVMLASHELRTPLHKIRSFLSLLREKSAQLPESTKTQIAVSLYSEVEHLTRLTNNLLVIAELESGNMNIEMKHVDLLKAIGEILSRFSEAAAAGRFYVDIPDEAQWVRADPRRLDVLLSSLVDNALRFSPADSPVRIRSLRSGLGRVSIEVEDEGRRIPVDQVDRVFASFYQVESPLHRQTEGFGVGLYLARQLAEEMEGSIGLRNDKVHGNVFIVQLRLAPSIQTPPVN